MCCDTSFDALDSPDWKLSIYHCSRMLYKYIYPTQASSKSHRRKDMQIVTPQMPEIWNDN